MSLFSTGLQYVSFQLAADTEAGLAAPGTFLTDWNEAVRLLVDLTGDIPGSHPLRVQSKLIIQEVADSDFEVLNGQFAVWSPVAGVIKLNRAYQQRFLDAANNSSLILEMAEAIGQAALCYQVQDPTAATSAQVVGRGNLAVGLARAVGMYPFSQKGQVSSVWAPARYLTFSQALSRELIRCYRKLRLGYIGDDLLGLSTLAQSGEVTDADVAYGMFLELFTAFGDWAALSNYLKGRVPVLLSTATVSGLFNRTLVQEYDDLTYELAQVMQANLRAVLSTWVFTRLDSMALLPEGLPELGTSRPIIMSALMRENIDPEILAREDRGANLPGVTLGGSDVFGIGQSGGPVLVLIDPPPVDGITYKGLKARILGSYEANGLPKDISLNYNVGEIGENPYTLVVPRGPVVGWVNESEVILKPGLYQQLWHADLKLFGEPQNPYRTKVVRWVDNQDQLVEIEVQPEIHVIIAKDSAGYNYVDTSGSQATQIISHEVLPSDRFQDPISSVVSETPGGSANVLRSMATFLNPDGTTTRSFVTITTLYDGEGNSLAKLVTTIPTTTDPMFYPKRERPVSENRRRSDVLATIGHPILIEQAGFSVRTMGSVMAAAAGVSVQLTGFQTQENVQTFLKALLPNNPVQVVDVPMSFATTIKQLQNNDVPGTTQAEKDLYRVEKFFEAFDQLPQETRTILSVVNPHTPFTIPQLAGVPPLSIPPSLAPTIGPNKTVPAIDMAQMAVGVGQMRKSEPLNLGVIGDAIRGLVDKVVIPVARAAWDQTVSAWNNTVTTTVAGVGLARDFLNNGVAGLAATHNDPHNPFTYMDGTFTDNVLGLFKLDTSPKFDASGRQINAGAFGVIDFSGNPRAVSGVLGALTGAASALLEAFSPGIASTIQKSVQENMLAIAQEDKVPAAAMVDIAQDMAGNVIDNMFGQDQSSKRAAHKVLDFLAGMAQDAIDGTFLVQDIHDILRIETLGMPLNLANPLVDTLNDGKDQSYLNYLNVVVGMSPEKDLQLTLGSDPQLQALLHTAYGDVPLFGTTGEPTFKLDHKDTSSGGLFERILGKNIVGIFTDFWGTNARLEKTNKHLTAMRAEGINATSLQNYRSAMIQEMVIQQAEFTFNQIQELGETLGADVSKSAFESAASVLEGTSTWANSGTSAVSSVAQKRGSLLYRVNGRYTPATPGALAAAVAEMREYERTHPGAEKPVYAGFPVAIVHAFEALDKRRESIHETLTKYAATRSFVNNALSWQQFGEDTRTQQIAKDNEKEARTQDFKMQALLQIKEEGGETYTFEVMPAVKASSPTQGLQAPGAGHGVVFRSSLNIAKLNVPGGSPIH